MDTKKAKGVFIKGMTIAKTKIPGPSLRTDDLTSIPTMFSKAKASVPIAKAAPSAPSMAKPVAKAEPSAPSMAKPIAKAIPSAPSIAKPEPSIAKPVAKAEPSMAKPIPSVPEVTEESLDENDYSELGEDEEDENNNTNDNTNNNTNENTNNNTNDTSDDEESSEYVTPKLVALQSAIRNVEQTDNYRLEDSQVYLPQLSRGFSKFITTTFSDFALPPRPPKLNYNACSTLEMRIYEYQKFVREYMRQASPYRGILVYHGLGSGKTCTSIATAEALYGKADKKIIVLTPISLQENFINELSVCGFQHFQLQNHWTPFDLRDPAQRLFAQEVVGIPASHIKRVMKTDPTFWMPDFTQKPNYDSLEDSQKTAIRTQIRQIIQNRITFIGYTGITHDELKRIACDQPTFFDDAVIIIDEVHNLTRLMRGKLEKYLKNVRGDAQSVAPAPGKKPKKIPFSYEPMTTDVWKPKLCGSSQKYDRAFLIYRLLAQARNSKIVALSGTPIVNFPEEIGILCNILHGYFHTVEDSITNITDQEIQKLELILKMHPRVQFFSVRKAVGYSVAFFTKVEDGYIKTFKGSSLQGLVHVGKDATPSSIQEIYQDVIGLAAAEGIKFKNKPIFTAMPLFPETIEQFTENFVNTETLHITNPLVFKKRITGLISYYKGAKEELMPSVVKDEIVECPMTAYSLGPYAEARKKERDEKTGKPGGAWEEMQGLAAESESASYRFRSRAACNFVFPKGIPRPFPSSKKEFKTSAKVEDIVLGDGEADAVEDDLASQGVAEAIGLNEADEEEDDQLVLEESASRAEDMRIPYQDRIKIALDALRSVAKRRFSLDKTKPEEEQLANYSGKFVEILKRIDTSPGSSLIYSQFLTLEGVGVFSIVLDTLGWAPLKLTGPDTDLRFTEETEQSLLQRPEQPRYIVYSGAESKTTRQTLINIFNTKLASLNPKITNILTESGLIDPATRKGNYKGEICKVFMITGAGAEGLSLRNVRTVHIMEPYWNTVRTDQVKGRAVRICSHSDLHYDEDPEKNERTVEIYTYISIIPESLKSARAIDQTLITEDGGVTTDQHILSIGLQKQQVSTDFFNAMKASAVDCTLNQTENDTVGCFIYDGPEDQFMFDPRLKEDRDKTDRELRTAAKPTLVGQPAVTQDGVVPSAPSASVLPKQKQEFRVISFKGVDYIVYPKDDYNALYLSKDRLFSKEVGKLLKKPDGKEKIELYKV